MSNTDKDYSLGQRIYRILSGFELALICFILLFLLTLFGTIEQKWIGLYQAIERYFDIGSLFVVPQQGDGKVIFLPLPGAYLVMGVLFVNLTLGGLVRARKGWKTVGVLISHSSVLVLLAAGAVSSFSKKEGIMFVFEGQHSDFAQSYHDHTIEVFEYGEDGSRGNPAVIANEHLRGMSRTGLLKVDMQEFPFSLEVRGFMLASKVMSATRNKAEGDEEKVIRKEMLNSMGKAHGGITYALADTAFGFAANTHGKYAVSIETSINHIEALEEGDVITAESVIEKVKNKVGFNVIEVKRGEDLVALFKGVVFRTNKDWEVEE